MGEVECEVLPLRVEEEDIGVAVLYWDVQLSEEVGLEHLNEATGDEEDPLAMTSEGGEEREEAGGQLEGVGGEGGVDGGEGGAKEVEALSEGDVEGEGSVHGGGGEGSDLRTEAEVSGQHVDALLGDDSRIHIEADAIAAQQRIDDVSRRRIGVGKDGDAMRRGGGGRGGGGGWRGG